MVEVTVMAKRVGKPPSEQPPEGVVKVRPIRKMHVTLRIKGTSQLIQHQWSEKAKAMMRSKHAGKKTKDREVRDPQREGEEAAYRTQDGKYGIPMAALKLAILSASHKDIGFEKTLVRKAVFILCKDANLVLEMECEEPTIKEDPVRVGQGSADLRYRPYFAPGWTLEVTFEIDAELVSTSDLVNLLDRAGFGVGIGEWRPEKNGDNGRFQVDSSFPIQERAA